MTCPTCHGEGKIWFGLYNDGAGLRAWMMAPCPACAVQPVQEGESDG